MAWTSTDLSALESAIATGATEVQYTDKKVTYRSLRDMLALRDLIRRDMGLDTKSKRRRVAVVSKGL